MKPNKPALTKTLVAKTATKPATKALGPAAAKKTTPAAATKTAKTPVLLTSPRVTKAAANAKKALTPLLPTTAKPAKPAAPKKPKPAAKPKVTAPAAVAQTAPTPPQSQAQPATTAPLPRVTTTIEAFIDVGFGNRLTLRGEGAGLSWEHGLTMNCIGNAEWGIALEAADAPLTFKFLLNDERWSLGENYTLAPGKTGAFTPEF